MCWSGAAAGLLDSIDNEHTTDPYRLSARGAMRAECVSATSLLTQAGHLADCAFKDRDGAMYNAIAARSSIERSCTHVVDRFARAWGPRPFVLDPQIAQRVVDLQLYLRQHHGEADLAALGSLDTPTSATSERP